jgi:sugar phosphate isomerase/epimerase
MGKIKRGISLYSYQQTQFFKILNTWEQIREVRENLHTDGIEIISQTTIPRYPFPSDEWVHKWHETMAKYNMTAVAYDPHLDVLQFRDHVMDPGEGAERLKRDMRLAKKLGFKMIRTHGSQTLPNDTMAIFSKCLPLAEELDIPLALEIHAPYSLTEGHTIDIIEYADKVNTKHLGIYPDFGIYQVRIQKPLADWYIRRGCASETVALAQQVCDEHMLDKMSNTMRSFKNFMYFENYLQRGIPIPSEAEPAVREYIEFINKNIKNPTKRDYDLFGWPLKMPHFDGSELRNVIKYVKGFHGKFYDMTEIPGKPGQYEEVSVDYDIPFKVLKETGWEGYVNSENEGQRHYQDMDYEFYQDEVEQARRHHKMMARLLGEPL